MIHVEQAIRRVNRDVALGWAIHLALGLVLVVALVVGSAAGVPPILLAAIPCTLWILLAINGVRETRAALQWPALIATGQLEEAERQIERMIRGFSVLRSVKLLSLHQLAVVKMAQKQWVDALQLSKAIAGYKVGKQESLHRASLLVMASAGVQAGAMHDAYAAMSELRRTRLTLDEQLSLLLAEVTYCGRIGAWGAMMDNLLEKIRLAELMPAELAAQVQAWLAIAARQTGRRDWSGYLQERCQLLVDPARLFAEEPALRALWDEDEQNKQTR